MRRLIGLKMHWNVRLRKYPSQFLGSCSHVWKDNVLLLQWAEFSFLEILDAISIIPVSLSTGSKGLLDVAAAIADRLFSSEGLRFKKQVMVCVCICLLTSVVRFPTLSMCSSKMAACFLWRSPLVHLMTLFTELMCSVKVSSSVART